MNDENAANAASSSTPTSNSVSPAVNTNDVPSSKANPKSGSNTIAMALAVSPEDSAEKSASSD